MSFKRGQLEGALHALLSGPANSVRDRMADPVRRRFSIRLRRLLEVDRERSQDYPERSKISGLAFHEAMPAGKGRDVLYSVQRAFNLAIAMELVGFGFTIRKVVDQMIDMQEKLRAAYDRAVRTYETSGSLHSRSDRDPLTGKVIRPVQTLSGQGEHADLTIFLVVRRVEVKSDVADVVDGQSTIQDDDIGYDFVWTLEDLKRHFQGGAGSLVGGVFVIELSEVAARLQEMLEAQPMIRRGRRRLSA